MNALFGGFRFSLAPLLLIMGWCKLQHWAPGSVFCIAVCVPDNPAFVDTSLERQSHLPAEGTQYEFARYGYPNEVEAGVPMEGPHQLHRRHTTGSSRYGQNEEDVNDNAMKNLLKRLPSRQLGQWICFDTHKCFYYLSHQADPCCSWTALV